MTSSENPGIGDQRDQGEVDLSVLDALLALRKPGAPDPRRRVITIYMDSAPKLMEAIRKAFAASDETSLKKAAHSLKSASMNVGAKGLGAICADLEGLAMAVSLDDAGGLIQRAETSYKEVIASMEEALRRMSQ
jgi:HPt (histidine-containing phosphotransfer) domain-containing protein